MEKVELGWIGLEKVELGGIDLENVENLENCSCPPLSEERLFCVNTSLLCWGVGGSTLPRIDTRPVPVQSYCTVPYFCTV